MIYSSYLLALRNPPLSRPPLIRQPAPLQKAKQDSHATHAGRHAGRQADGQAGRFFSGLLPAAPWACIVALLGTAGNGGTVSGMPLRSCCSSCSTSAEALSTITLPVPKCSDGSMSIMRARGQ